MTDALNTMVFGGPESCAMGGDALDRLAGCVQKGGDQSRRARSVAEAGWDGPAYVAFHNASAKPTDVADDLAFTCQEAMRALKTFASSLRSILNKMATTRYEAVSGGLKLEGYFILPPEPAPPKPEAPYLPRAEDADGAYKAYEAAMAKWVPLADEYNRKATLFNKCSDNVRDARKKEDEAHTTLCDALKSADGSKFEDLVISTPTSATVAGIVALPQTIRSGRLQAFTNLASAHVRESTLLQRLANGQVLGLSEVERAQLIRQAANAGDDVSRYTRLIDDYAKFERLLGPSTYAALAAHPNIPSALEDAAARGRIGAETLRGILKSTPFVGSALTIGMEAWNASTGGQTWAEAGARSVGGLAGAATGAVLGGALGELVAGPLGAVVVGVAGSVYGGINGADVAQSVLPDQEYAQPKADIADTRIVSKEDTSVLQPDRNGPAGGFPSTRPAPAPTESAPTGAVPTPPPAPR